MQMNRLIDHLRRPVPDEAGQTDGQLLDLFVRDQDGAALAALVRRHAPMVWGVCRRVLSAHHDAEDAFQATFLVLVRKAEAVPRPELVGNWLYGVARQTAVRMRALAARRAVRERQVAVMPEPATADEYLWNDLRPVLDDELCRLPEKYRALLVLCDLEERTRADVARLLAIPEGTVASRLAAARAMLAKRLARRGLVVSGTLLGAVLASRTTAEAVAAGVGSITSRTAALLEAGTGTAAAISPTVAELIRGVTGAMRLSKIKAVTAVLLAAGLALGGISVGLGRSGGSPAMDRPNAPAAPPANPPAQEKNRPEQPVAPDGEIVGQLLDAATGKPVEGATVACGAVINDSGKGGGANAVTDAQGRYRLAVPSPGIYNVWLKAFDKDPAKTAAADDGILVEARKASESQLLLVTGRKVTGKVIDTDDKPVENVRVSCNSPARPMSGGVESTKTKADGSFEFSLPPGRAYIYAIVPDANGGFGVRASAQAHVEVPPTGAVAAVTLTLKPPDERFGDPVWLKRSTPGTEIVRRAPVEGVSGTVVDADGKPIAGGKVFRSDGPIVAANDAGEFRVESGKGTQFVMYAFAAGYHVWFGTPTSGDVLKIALEPKPKKKDPPPGKKEEPEKPPTEPLARLVSLSADKQPLKDALAKLAAAAGLEVEFDTDALKKAGLDLEKPVSAKVENEPLARAIGYVIDWNAHPGMMREVRRGKLVFTTLAAWQARIAEKLPEWMKPLYNKGLSARLDDDDAVASVTAGAVVTDEVMEKLKTLPKLRELHIETTKALTPAGLAHLAKMPRLEKLSLFEVNTDGPGLGDDIIRSLVGLDSLRELSITECGTTDAGAKLLEKFPQLTSLSLRQEGRLTDEALKSIGTLTRLKELSLNSYVGTRRLGWMRFSADGIRHLKGLKELESLHLVGQEVPAEALAFPKLTALGLGHSAVDDAVGKRIGELRALRHLELTYCGLGDEGLKRIAALPELRRFNISSSHVTDAGVGHFRTHKRLEHVTLRVSGLTDESLGHLAQIETLTGLDLYGSGKPGVDPGRNFSIAGLQQLKKLPKLERLSLTNFDVVGGGYGGLRELKHLRELNFMMANVTDAELESLAEALPGARISAATGGRSWPGPKRKP